MTVSPVLAVTLRYALVPVVFTVVGAGLGVFVPSVARWRSHVLHLAAGVVFSIVAVELLPEIQRRALVWDVVWGFALGVITMLAVDKLLDRIRGDDDGREERRARRLRFPRWKASAPLQAEHLHWFYILLLNCYPGSAGGMR